MSDTFDFRLCARKDGSLYGTAGQCRIGSEVSRSDVLARGEFGHLSGKKRKTANELLNSLSDEQFARVTSAVSQLLLVKPSPKVGVMTPEMVMAIKSRASLLERLSHDPKSLETLLKPVSDKELEAAWSLLTSKLQFRASAVTVDGVSKNEGIPTAVVRKQLFRRWLEQDGRDPYTGLPVNFIETELEHVRSLASLGAKANNVKNLVWIQRDVNNSKLHKSMPEWVKGVSETSLEKASEKYKNALERTNKKGDLKRRVKEDIKLLSTQADKLIQQYGKYSIYFLREAGFRTLTSDPGGNRARSIAWMKNATSPSGEKVDMTEFIVKKLPVWPPRKMKEAQEIVKAITGIYSDGRLTLAQANQMIYDELKSL
jgi:hypothetical protein